MAEKARLHHFFWESLGWLFPPACAGCGASGYRWCPKCQVEAKQMAEPLCRVCGTSIAGGEICPTCRASPPAFTALRSWLVFEGPTRNALHSLKYDKNIPLGEALALELAPFARRLAWSVDMVVPVPAGRQRLKERGYNQAALLAKPLAEWLDLPFSSKILSRQRETASQVGLSPSQRRANVAGAFQADPGMAGGRCFLLVDDVATTGATLGACAQALKESGAVSVHALTFARALPHHGYEIV